MVELSLDFDTPWKSALERYFALFLAFFFPSLHAEIDWRRGHEFQDAELQQISRDAATGRRYADKLVKVWLRDGTDLWLLVHIEIQGQADPDFARRMHIYNNRIYDRFDHEVISLAVLADERPRWRPTRFRRGRSGFRAETVFPIVKLLDYRARWAELEASANPFAVVVMAHLQAQATRRDPRARLEWKKRLVRSLYQRGFSRPDILELFTFIDWLLVLPADLEQDFREDLERFQEEMRMPYITSIERDGIAKGLQQGHLEMARTAVFDALETRFEDIPPAVRAAIVQIDNVEQLRDLHRRAITIPSAADFEALLGTKGE
jgi:hypothetical protein